MRHHFDRRSPIVVDARADGNPRDEPGHTTRTGPKPLPRRYRGKSAAQLRVSCVGVVSPGFPPVRPISLMPFAGLFFGGGPGEISVVNAAVVCTVSTYRFEVEPLSVPAKSPDTEALPEFRANEA